MKRVRNLAGTLAVVAGTLWLGTLVPREFPRVQRKSLWRTMFPPPPAKPFVFPPAAEVASAPLPKRKIVRVEVPPVVAKRIVVKPVVDGALPAISKWRLGEGGVLEHLETSGWVRAELAGEAVSVSDRAGGEAEVTLADGSRWVSKQQGRQWEKLPL